MKRKIGKILAVAALASFSIAGSASAATYQVRPGDTLWKIATWHGTTVEQLMAHNGLTSTWIYPGQTLKIPGETRQYVVQQSDTMWLISRKFGVSLNALVRANPHIADPNNIWAGLIVNIPPIPSKPASFADGVFPLPANRYKTIVDNYGETRDWSPNGPVVRSHEGVDIFADKWTPVYSVMDGTVVNYGWNEYGGWRLTVQTDDSTAFYYAHLAGYAKGIAKGVKVRKGQLIGYVGNTGYGPVGTEGKFESHLHFGIYKTNRSPWTTIDPYPYLLWWEYRSQW